MATSETIHLLADIITLVLFFASCAVGFLRIFKLFIFCRYAIKQINLIGQPVPVSSGGHNVERVRRLAELLKKIRRILRWSYIPYIIRHFLWHEPGEINALLVEAQGIAWELGIMTSDASPRHLEANTQQAPVYASGNQHSQAQHRHHQRKSNSRVQYGQTNSLQLQSISFTKPGQSPNISNLKSTYQGHPPHHLRAQRFRQRPLESPINPIAPQPD